MKILNTIKQYVSNGVAKALSPLVLDMNAISSDTKEALDDKIIQLENQVNGIRMFCQPQKILLNSIEGWTITSTLDCYVSGNVCYVNGAIAKSSGSYLGEYNLPVFPAGIRPPRNIFGLAPVVLNGTTYRVHFNVFANGNINLFFYDEVPLQSIYLNFTFQLDTGYVGS